MVLLEKKNENQLYKTFLAYFSHFYILCHDFHYVPALINSIFWHILWQYCLVLPIQNGNFLLCWTMKMQNSFGQNLFHSSEFAEGLFGDQGVLNKDPTVWLYVDRPIPPSILGNALTQQCSTHPPPLHTKVHLQVKKIGIFLV